MELTMAGALNAALRDSMREDDTVVVYGEDVGRLGGVFRITDGLQAEMGSDRCFDTPVAESGIAGTAIGMALYGLRPVVEMQFDGFSYPALNQVISHVAKYRNRTRGRVGLPMVIRIPYGGGIGAVEHHSESPEAYYSHTAGLTVVSPGTPADAYALLRASIAFDDPVIFLEPKRRYWLKEDLDLPVTAPPIGEAVIRRTGTTATLIAYGPMVTTAIEAATRAFESWRHLTLPERADYLFKAAALLREPPATELNDPPRNTVEPASASALIEPVGVGFYFYFIPFHPYPLKRPRETQSRS